MRTFAEVTDNLHDIHPAARTQHAIDARDLLGNFRAITLGEAACCDQDLVVPLALCQFAKDIDRFLLGRTNKTTGIDDQHIRPRGIVHCPVTITHKQLRHGIRVDCILCTTE